MLWATRHCPDPEPWLEFVANAEGDPKQKTLIQTASLERAAARFAAGEQLPQIGEVLPMVVPCGGQRVAEK